MKKFSMTCTCGDVMSVDANTREEAVDLMKERMHDEAIAAHMSEKHPGETPMTKDQVDMAIDQQLQEAPLDPAPTI